MRRYLFRAVAVALAAVACYLLSRRFTPWVALAIWVGGVAVFCAVVAVLLKRQPIGRVGAINYAAGFVLPWGYGIGKGTLAPIAVTSAIVWALLGAAVMLAGSHLSEPVVLTTTAEADGTHAVLRTLLLISWIIDGGALLYTIGVMVKSPGTARSLVKVASVLVIMLIASVVFALQGTGAMLGTALAIAGGPPLVLGGAYGLFIIVMMTAGRNARWN